MVRVGVVLVAGGVKKGGERDVRDGEGGLPWTCFPVGELPGEPWWNAFGWGRLHESQIQTALRAHSQQVLADWATGRRWISTRSGAYYSMNAHVMNEPSGQEDATIASVDQPAPCKTYGDGLRLCSTLILAHTVRQTLLEA